MTAPGPAHIRGYNGTVIFDGMTVTIARTGFLARTTVGKGEKRIPVRQITSVQFKPAGPLMNGFIQFGMGGAVERRSRFGRQTQQAVQDENSVIFTTKHQDGFAWLRDAVEHAMSAAAQPMVQAAPDPVAQLQRLAQLHQSGALTDREFTEAKAALLGHLRRSPDNSRR